jgi:hypothetical protein
MPDCEAGRARATAGMRVTLWVGDLGRGDRGVRGGE